jgi:transketolase C-terminal domain/subunit
VQASARLPPYGEVTGKGDKEMTGVQMGMAVVAVGLILVAFLCFYQGRRIDQIQQRVDALEKKQR